MYGEPHSDVLTWLGTYRARAPRGLHLSDNSTVRLDDDNEVQPDAALWREEPGGPYLLRGYIIGAPQLVVEIAASSVSYDLHDKLKGYERNGVREYVVWRVEDEAIDWLRLQDGHFVRVEPGDQGVIESTVFPGLRLNVARLLDGDLAAVLDEL